MLFLLQLIDEVFRFWFPFLMLVETCGDSICSPQSPMLKLVDIPLMYPSFPQAVTLMRKSGESLTVKPKVNLSSPISEIQTYSLNIVYVTIQWTRKGYKVQGRDVHLSILQQRALVYSVLTSSAI